MSVEAIALVLHHSRAKGAAKLVLVGIANHEGDGGAWPTVETLAKYANVSERAVQQSTAKLVQLGELAIYRQAGGTRDLPDSKRPNRYEVLVRCPPTCDGTTRHRVRAHRRAEPLRPFLEVASPDLLRVKQASPGEAGFTPTGEAGFTQTVHSITPMRTVSSNVTTPRARDELCQLCYRERSICRQADAKALPEDRHEYLAPKRAEA